MTDHEASTDPRHAHHDMGGLPAGPVEPNEHDYLSTSSGETSKLWDPTPMTG
jgi:hypothetical protein